MSEDNYNLDVIPNSIFDNIIMDDDMNLNDIFNSVLEDPSLLPTSVSDDDYRYVTKNYNAYNAMNSSVGYPILQHDCMWSGTCDISHPSKKKGKPFSVEAILKEFEASSDSDSGKHSLFIFIFTFIV